MKKETIHIRARILLPLGVTLFLICFSGFLATIWFQQQYVFKVVDDRLQNARTLFDELINIEAEILQALGNSYGNYPDLQKAFLAGDRETLLKLATPLFKEIRKNHEITHFYFLSLDKSCFLRVHNPSRHGDLIDRYTLDRSSYLEEPATGLELGPLGTLTLRAVQPWFVDGRKVGFIELGKEIDHITPLLKRIMGLDLIFAIEKKYLNRELWEEGLRMLNKTGGWNDFTDHVITSSTFPKLPGNLNRILSDHRSEHDRSPFDVYHYRKVFRCGIIPLYDAAGIEVGDVFTYADYTTISSNRNLFIFFTSLCILLVASFCVFLVFYFRTLEKKLHESFDRLEEKIGNHRKSRSDEPEEQLPFDKADEG